MGGLHVYPLLFQVDFEQLTENLGQLERRSRAAEDSLRSLAKHDLAPALRARLTHFLGQAVFKALETAVGTKQTGIPLLWTRLCPVEGTGGSLSK